MDKTKVGKPELAALVKEKWNELPDVIEVIQNKTVSTFQKEDVMKLLDPVFDSIMELTDKHGQLQIMGVATFNKVRREQRKGRNPQTNEEVIIPAKNTVTIKPGTTFKNKITQ